MMGDIVFTFHGFADPERYGDGAVGPVGTFELRAGASHSVGELIRKIRPGLRLREPLTSLR